MSATISCDLAIVGGGLAGGLIARAVHARHPSAELRLIEASSHIGGNHLWSFFASDIAPADRWLASPLISHQWTRYDVAFPAYRRTLKSPYHSIDSRHFERVVLSELPGRAAMLGRKVLAVTSKAVVLADGDQVEAKGVIDCRGAGDLTALELGWLMAAQAVGGLLGGVFVGAIARRVPTVRLIGLGSITFGLIDLAIFNYPAFNLTFMPAIWIGIALFVLVGIPGVWTQSAVQTLLQSSVPDAYLGRVFGALGTILGVLGLIGTLIAGFSGERLGIVTVLNIQGAGYIAAGLLALVLLREVVGHQLSPVSSQ